MDNAISELTHMLDTLKRAAQNGVTLSRETLDQFRGSDFLGLRDLKRRGWTDGLVKSFLGEPDRLATNPHVALAKPMRLYRLDRVSEHERTPEFETARDAALRRAQQAKKVADAKQSALMDLAGVIELPALTESLDQLTVRATEINKDRYFESSQAATQALEDTAVDLAMTHLSQCEWRMDTFFKHSGIRPARQKLRRRMLEAIITTYPALRDAALRRAIQEQGNAE